MDSSGPERGADGTGEALVPQRLHRAVAAFLFLAAAGLGVAEIAGDSTTVDEVVHLTSAIVHLRTGDVHLTVDHPPLTRDLAALPLLLMDVNLPERASPAYRAGDFGAVGREFFYGKNDGERLLARARVATIVLWLALAALVHATARRLFGPDAALLSLGIVCLCPTFRAHGHLVTTDLPAALTMLLVVVTFARLCSAITPLRLAAACTAFGIASATKYSWPVVLPVLALMAVFAAVTKRARPVPLLLSLAAMGATAWLSVWACYGFRYGPFTGTPAPDARMFFPPPAGRAAPATLDEAWDAAFRDWKGEPLFGTVPSTVRLLRRYKVLPESYLFGIMALKRSSYPRVTYFRGDVGWSGSAAYFPVAFAIKTPLPTLFLFAAGLAALLMRTAPRGRDPVLLLGVLLFGATYAIFAIGSGLNIGHRHLLPLYPVVALVAGAAACWRKPRAARWAVGVLAVGLVAVSLASFPNDLGYFNELVGGWKNGYRWLADSNVDWGQDIKRLARWVHANGDPVVKLAILSPADPKAYGLNAEAVVTPYPDIRPGALTAGIYVVSANQLVSLLFVPSRDSFWENPRTREYYASLYARLAPHGREKPADLPRAEALAWDNFRTLSAARLLNALKRRAPDERIGTSLFVFRLSQGEIDAFVRP